MNPPPFPRIAKILCRSALVLGLSFGAAAPLHAQRGWTGLGENPYWATEGNWSGETLPGSGDDALFDPADFGSGEPSLNGASYSVRSLIFNGSANATLATGGGTPSLTLASGNITKNSIDGSVTIAPNIVLGATGTWNNATPSGNARALRVNGVVSGDYGIVKTGVGDLILQGNNTFGGGLELQSGALWLQHSNSLGTGALAMKNAVGVDLWFGMAGMNLANDITFTSSGGVSFRSSASAPFYTLSGDITGSLSSGGFNFRGNPATWVVKGAIDLTGLNASGLGLNSEATGGHYTLILEQNPSLAGAINGRFLIGNTGANAGRANLLVSKAITVGGQFIDLDNANGINTVGGIHGEGTAKYTASVRLFNATTGAGNLATLHAGAVTEFSGEVTDLTKSIHLHINERWRMFTETSGSDTVEQTPLGTVLLSRAAGNVYDGGTTVHAGTLLVANTSGSATGTGAVAVKAGAVLGGGGIIAPEGTAGVTLESGALLAANSSTGMIRLNGAATSGTLLTMEEGAAFRFELGAPGTAAGIALWNYASGDLSLDDNAVNIMNTGGLAAGEYTLFAFYGDDGLTPTASGILSGLQIGSGLEGFAGSYLSYEANSIMLHVVPEPGTWGLLALGGVAAFVMRRRRR